MSEDSVRLKVAAAMPKDQGRGIVRLNSDVRSHLGIRSGDYVLLKGGKETVAVAWPSLKEDEVLDMVRMDGLIRNNAGARLGEMMGCDYMLVGTIMRANIKKWTEFSKAIGREISEYEAAVADITDINAFKLVTDPFEFNRLHWTGRRQIIFDGCGDVSDLEVLDAIDPEIKIKDGHSKLYTALGKVSIDDHKARIKARKTKINNELKKIPVRIDELDYSMKDVAEPDLQRTAILENQLTTLQEKLRSLQTNEALSQKQIRVNDLVFVVF